MKTIILLLLSACTYAQTTLDVKLDPTVLINEKSINVLIEVTTDLRMFKSDSFRFGVSFEAFTDRNFYASNILLGWQLEVVPKLYGTIGIQSGFLWRTNTPVFLDHLEVDRTYTQMFIHFGINGSIKYFPFDNNGLGIVITSTLVTRPDLDFLWGDKADNTRHNVYIGLTYKFN